MVVLEIGIQTYDIGGSAGVNSPTQPDRVNQSGHPLFCNSFDYFAEIGTVPLRVLD